MLEHQRTPASRHVPGSLKPSCSGCRHLVVVAAIAVEGVAHASQQEGASFTGSHAICHPVFRRLLYKYLPRHVSRCRRSAIIAAAYTRHGDAMCLHVDVASLATAYDNAELRWPDVMLEEGYAATITKFVVAMKKNEPPQSSRRTPGRCTVSASSPAFVVATSVIPQMATLVGRLSVPATPEKAACVPVDGRVAAQNRYLRAAALCRRQLRRRYL